jgi:hypothetical protein
MRWVACEVKLPGGVQMGVVKTSNEKLYFALKDLLELAKAEHKRLLEVQRAPKQGEFEYGTSNPGLAGNCLIFREVAFQMGIIYVANLKVCQAYDSQT